MTVSTRAGRDVRNIARRSKATWGVDQATRYTAALDDAFNRLASYPMMGREHSVLRSGLRRYPVGEHVVLYLAANGGVTILRVVHQRMDLGRVKLT